MVSLNKNTSSNTQIKRNNFNKNAPVKKPYNFRAKIQAKIQRLFKKRKNIKSRSLFYLQKRARDKEIGLKRDLQTGLFGFFNRWKRVRDYYKNRYVIRKFLFKSLGKYSEKVLYRNLNKVKRGSNNVLSKWYLTIASRLDISLVKLKLVPTIPLAHYYIRTRRVYVNNQLVTYPQQVIQSGDFVFFKPNYAKDRDLMLSIYKLRKRKRGLRRIRRNMFLTRKNMTKYLISSGLLKNKLYMSNIFWKEAFLLATRGTTKKRYVRLPQKVYEFKKRSKTNRKLKLKYDWLSYLNNFVFNTKHKRKLVKDLKDQSKSLLKAKRTNKIKAHKNLMFKNLKVRFLKMIRSRNKTLTNKVSWKAMKLTRVTRMRRHLIKYFIRNRTRKLKLLRRMNFKNRRNNRNYDRNRQNRPMNYVNKRPNRQFNNNNYNNNNRNRNQPMQKQYRNNRNVNYMQKRQYHTNRNFKKQIDEIKKVNPRKNKLRKTNRRKAMIVASKYRRALSRKLKLFKKYNVCVNTYVNPLIYLKFKKRKFFKLVPVKGNKKNKNIRVKGRKQQRRMRFNKILRKVVWTSKITRNAKILRTTLRAKPKRTYINRNLKSYKPRRAPFLTRSKLFRAAIFLPLLKPQNSINLSKKWVKAAKPANYRRTLRGIIHMAYRNGLILNKWFLPRLRLRTKKTSSKNLRIKTLLRLKQAKNKLYLKKSYIETINTLRNIYSNQIFSSGKHYGRFKVRWMFLRSRAEYLRLRRAGVRNLVSKGFYRKPKKNIKAMFKGKRSNLNYGLWFSTFDYGNKKLCFFNNWVDSWRKEVNNHVLNETKVFKEITKNNDLVSLYSNTVTNYYNGKKNKFKKNSK